MSTLEFKRRDPCGRFGLKGPKAADWLQARGLVLPAAPNTWAADATLLVARLGGSEFFLEDCARGLTLCGAEPWHGAYPPGVYPVLREDAAFALCGDGACDVLAQVCNVNFGDLDVASHPVIMTMMIGVSVLVVPQAAGAGHRYLIWCDPTFGDYLEESLRTVVIESGGKQTATLRGVST